MTNNKAMRPCVKKILDTGLREKLPKQLFEDLRKKMTYVIIHDLRRINIEPIDIKQMLLSWNDRCIMKLSSGDAKRQLCGFVDWFLKKECKLSCKGLADFCLYPEGTGCAFQKKAELRKVNYTTGEAQVYLERTFPKYGIGYRMGYVLEALHKAREEKGVDRLYIGLRTLAAILYDIRSWRVETKELSKYLYRLQEEKFLKIEKGEKGSFVFRHSNAYTFLDWHNPENETSHNISIVGEVYPLLCGGNVEQKNV